MIIQRFKYPGMTLSFKREYDFQIKMNAHGYTVQDDYFNVYVWAEDLEKLWLRVKEDFLFLWNEYALEKDENLATAALSLKNRLLDEIEANYLLPVCDNPEKN